MEGSVTSAPVYAQGIKGNCSKAEVKKRSSGSNCLLLATLPALPQLVPPAVALLSIPSEQGESSRLGNEFPRRAS